MMFDVVLHASLFDNLMIGILFDLENYFDINPRFVIEKNLIAKVSIACTKDDNIVKVLRSFR